MRNTLSGDIGEILSGGSNKQITWKFEADNVYLDAYVFVQINATVIKPPPPPVIEEPEEEIVLKMQDDQTDNQTDSQEGSQADTQEDSQVEEPVVVVRQEDLSQEDVPEKPGPETGTTKENPSETGE